MRMTEHRWRERDYNVQTSKTDRVRVNRNRITSFMFFNFPSNCGVDELWGTFRQYGRLTDIYMARKTLRDGRRFGFIRYLQVEDEEFMVRKLNTIRVGGMNIVVLKARERREEVKVGREGQNKQLSGSHIVHRLGNDSKRDQRKYSEVVNVRTKHNNRLENVGTQNNNGSTENRYSEGRRSQTERENKERLIVI